VRKALIFIAPGAILAAIIWVVFQLPRVDARLGTMLPAWAVVPGVLLVTAGASLVIACAGILTIEGRGTPFVLNPTSEFVAAGPYRYTRNPLYVGQVVLLIGAGLSLQSSAVLLFALAWFGCLHLFVVSWEEPDLTKRFGGTYQAYCKTVPRWPSL